MNNLLFKEEYYAIIGTCMEVQKWLGCGLLEIVYKDALEIELIKRGIPFRREYEFPVVYKGLLLPHSFRVDFLLYEEIIVEVKSTSSPFSDLHIAQTINYIKLANSKLGILINFGTPSLDHKRLVV
jgi:GxxExxY protein